MAEDRPPSQKILSILSVARDHHRSDGGFSALADQNDPKRTFLAPFGVRQKHKLSILSAKFGLGGATILMIRRQTSS